MLKGRFSAETDATFDDNEPTSSTKVFVAAAVATLGCRVLLLLVLQVDIRNHRICDTTAGVQLA